MSEIVAKLRSLEIHQIPGEILLHGISLYAEAADEIERLELELKEARAIALSAETEAHANHMRAQQAESEAAAMREALDFYALEGNYRWDIAPDPAGTAIPGTSPIDCDRGDKAQAALSTDAGRKVLNVVEAAKLVQETDGADGMRELREALVAMG